eukprot:9861716-Ditylum_brightwellii.AAC.1
MKVQRKAQVQKRSRNHMIRILVREGSLSTWVKMMGLNQKNDSRRFSMTTSHLLHFKKDLKAPISEEREMGTKRKGKWKHKRMC